jgi:hypothetical protein
MATTANGTFKIKNWDEKPYNEMEGGPKLTRAGIILEYHGDIEGESTLDYLMAYPTESSASFVGMERVTGRIGDRKGTYVLQHAGTFADGIAKDSYSVVPGSGTGELSGLRGEGSNTTGHEEPHRYTFNYSFE